MERDTRKNVEGKIVPEGLVENVFDGLRAEAGGENVLSEELVLDLTKVIRPLVPGFDIRQDGKGKTLGLSDGALLRRIDGVVAGIMKVRGSGGENDNAGTLNSRVLANLLNHDLRQALKSPDIEGEFAD